MLHQHVVKINQKLHKSSVGEGREEHQPPWVLREQQLEDDSSGPFLTTSTNPHQTEKGQTPGLQMRAGQMALDTCSRNHYNVSYGYSLNWV